MNQLFFVFSLAIIFSSLTTFAGTPVCPEFPYDLTEEYGVKRVRIVFVDETSHLTSLQKLQMLATARWYSQMWNEPTLTSGAAAVKFLKEGSEGGDLLYKLLRYQGVIYTQVLFYPGGNPYGLIFKGPKALAAQTDGDVGCLE